MSYAEVKPDFAKQSKNTSIELYKIILNTYLIITSLHTNCNEPEIKEQNCWEYQELSYFGEIVN